MASNQGQAHPHTRGAHRGASGAGSGGGATLWCLAFVLVTGCDPCVRLAEGRVCGATRVELDVEHPAGWPVVEGRVNGEPVRLLIDTGAGGHMVSSTLLGVTDDTWVRVRELCAGALCVEDALVWARDTELTQPQPGADRVHGLIGTPLLSQAVLRLQRGERLGIDLEGGGCDGTPLPMGQDEFGRPTVPLALGGLQLPDTVVDTGSLYTLLSDEQASTLVPPLGQLREDTICTIDGCAPGAMVGVAERACVGGLCEDGVPIKYPGATVVGATFFARADYALNLRSDTLTRCE